MTPSECQNYIPRYEMLQMYAVSIHSIHGNLTLIPQVRALLCRTRKLKSQGEVALL